MGSLELQLAKLAVNGLIGPLECDRPSKSHPPFSELLTRWIRGTNPKM